jgi:hypothetical protein
MSPSIADQHNREDDEQRIGRLILEAGDPAVVPRPEFVSRLRSLVLDSLGSPRRSRWRRPRLVVGSTVAAALAVAAATVAVMMLRPANAWAQVALALQEKPWVHSKTVGPDGKVYGESWFSVKNGVSAFRHGTLVEYHDTTLRTYTKYVASEGAIYLLRENPDLNSEDPDFFRQLLESKGPAKSPVFGMEVVAQSRRDIVEDGRAWVDIELTLKVIAGDRKQTMRFRVDPKTKLPHSCVFQSIEGPVGTSLFDYPDRGPADIYDLGVPRTAKIVDRLPTNDLDAVLAGLKAGRVRFDDYRGIAEMGGLGVKRVWRKGRKWRAELLLPSPKEAQQFPRDADAAWWKEHQNDYNYFVQSICDGEQVYYYDPVGKSFMPDADGPPRPKLSMTQPINPSADPFMPWPDLFPEHIGHPAVWQPSDDRDFVLEPKPTDGPPGAIRLRVRDTGFPDARLPDVYKLWIDPRKNYMALRAETSVFESTTTNPPKIAYIDTKVIESTARSPGGHLYPTRVVRTTSNFKGEQVWRYLLDFEAPLPDELFQPLKL